MSIVSGTVGGVMGANATEDAARTGAQATKDAAEQQVAEARRQYDTTRLDFSPFRQPADRAMATLQSAIYGGPVAYGGGGTALTLADINAANNEMISKYQAQPGGGAPITGYRNEPTYVDTGNGLVEGLPTSVPIYGERPSVTPQQMGLYDPNKKYWRTASGQIVDQDPNQYATFQPQESEGFKYTKQRTLDDLGRQLRMMGRGSGTVAANAMGRTLGDLNASNEDKQYGRLVDLIKTGQGAAGTIASSGQNASNAITGAYGQMGQANSLAAMQSGMANANLYGGLGAASAGTFSNALKAYDYGKTAGLWGGGGGSSSVYPIADGDAYAAMLA